MFKSSITEKTCTEMTEASDLPEDPSCPIKGMYRILDLITEQGNNGLGKYLSMTIYTTLMARQKSIRL